MIDPKTEETFRELVGHAIQNRTSELARVLAEAGEKGYGAVAPLVIRAAAYVAIYAPERWPNDADLRETARIAAKSGTGLDITEDDMYRFLSKSVFGSEPVLSIFEGNENAAVIPLFTLANLLVSFKPPQGKGWNTWLDVIESAIEAADQARPIDLPAMTYRYLKK